MLIFLKAGFKMFDLIFRGFAGRQIAVDLGEADQPAVVIAQGGDGDIGPESRAVFAQAPALFDGAAYGAWASDPQIGSPKATCATSPPSKKVDVRRFVRSMN